MNHKQALIELATAVLDMKKARDLYEDSGFSNAQERFEALSDKEEDVFEKAEELLAAANQPNKPPFYEFQERIKEWADVFFSLESGRLGKTVHLQEALDDFRSIWKYATVTPFLKCLKGWAEGNGLCYDYGTFRGGGLVRRAIIISPNLSNN